MNIHYIRAAIEENTGIRLDLEDVKRILVEERMLSPSKAKNIIFRGYGDFFDKPAYARVEEVKGLIDIEEDVFENEEE